MTLLRSLETRIDIRCGVGTALLAATRGDYEQQQQSPPKHDKKNSLSDSLEPPLSAALRTELYMPDYRPRNASISTTFVV